MDAGEEDGGLVHGFSQVGVEGGDLLIAKVELCPQPHVPHGWSIDVVNGGNEVNPEKSDKSEKESEGRCERGAPGASGEVCE